VANCRFMAPARVLNQPDRLVVWFFVGWFEWWWVVVRDSVAWWFSAVVQSSVFGVRCAENEDRMKRNGNGKCILNQRVWPCVTESKCKPNIRKFAKTLIGKKLEPVGNYSIVEVKNFFVLQKFSNFRTKFAKK